jgi:hypothetical protein
MPLSWNNVNTHVAGDVLPLADWNQAATALNSMVGTWTMLGSVGASTTTNGTPPYFAFAGSTTLTASSGSMSLAIPNGGFPNGVILSLANIYSGVAETYVMFPNQGTTTKTTLTWVVNNSSTGAAFSGAVQFGFLAIGY